MTEALNRRVLILSNGHGEDLIGATLAKKLREVAPELEINALPVVGLGAAYESLGIPLAFTGKNLPSGGFLRNSLGNLLMDLRGGLVSLTVRQIRALTKLRDDIRLVVCVGDVYLVLLAGFFMRRPLFFLPTAKSDYIAPHWPVEVRFMGRFCSKIFPRDAVTADSLARQGLPAQFVGNLMMDALNFTAPDFNGVGNEWIIGLLPGSRQEAYINMVDLARVVTAFRELVDREAEGRPTRFLVALSGGLSFSRIGEELTPLGWKDLPPAPEETVKGIVGHLEYEGGDGRVRISVAKGRFADILAASDAVIGMAGTANEQAVGLGKPVVTFPGRGPQFTEKFVRIQKRLLGDSISVQKRDPSAVARELLQILTDGAKREYMAEIGRERMGEPGGAEKIALQIKEFLLSSRVSPLTAQ